MIITAKFASTCPKCSRPITPGSGVEWSKGSKATHVDCSAAPASAGPSVTSTAGKCSKCGRACKHGYPTCYSCSTASKTCRMCGHVERRNARGYCDGDWVRNGFCQSCREEMAEY